MAGNRNRLLPQFYAENKIDAFKGVLLSAVFTVTAATAVTTLGLVATPKVFDLSQDSWSVIICVTLIMPFLGFRCFLETFSLR